MPPPLRTFLHAGPRHRARGPAAPSGGLAWGRHAPPTAQGAQAAGLRGPNPHLGATDRPSCLRGVRRPHHGGVCRRFSANTGQCRRRPPLAAGGGAGGEGSVAAALRWAGVRGVSVQRLCVRQEEPPPAGLRPPQPVRVSLGSAWRRGRGARGSGVNGAGRGVQPARLRLAPGRRGLWNLPSRARAAGQRRAEVLAAGSPLPARERQSHQEPEEKPARRGSRRRARLRAHGERRRAASLHGPDGDLALLRAGPAQHVSVLGRAQRPHRVRVRHQLLLHGPAPGVHHVDLPPGPALRQPRAAHPHLRTPDRASARPRPRGRGGRAQPTPAAPHLPLHPDHAGDLGAVRQVHPLGRPGQVPQAPHVQVIAPRARRPQLLLLRRKGHAGAGGGRQELAWASGCWQGLGRGQWGPAGAGGGWRGPVWASEGWRGLGMGRRGPVGTMRVLAAGRAQGGRAVPRGAAGRPRRWCCAPGRSGRSSAPAGHCRSRP